MLEQLRNASEKPWAKVLMGVLIFSFVGWGVASWIFGESSVDDAIARVGGRPIKIAAFDHEKNLALSMMSRDQQKQIYTDRAMQSLFLQQVLSRMASQLMLEKHAEYLGFSVATSAIADAIHQTSAFQQNGRFSLEKFDMLLASNGMSEEYYADMVRRQLLRDMVLMGIADSVYAPEFMSRAAFNARHAVRNIEYAAVKYADFKVSGNPTDDQLREVYARNPKMLPEYRTVSYVLVPVKNMSEPDLYDAGYTAAQRLEDAIVSGDTLAAAAKKRGAKHADLGAFASDRKSKNGAIVSDSILTDMLIGRIFGMEQGLESEIFETKQGFVIFRVDKIEPAAAVPMESMRSELTAQWRKEEQKKQAYLEANEILKAYKTYGDGKAYNKNDVDVVALMKLLKKIIKDVKVTRINGAPIEVLTGAFANQVGTTTIVPGSDVFYVLAVTGETAPKPDTAAISAIRKESQTMLAHALLDDYTGFLARKYPMKINERMYKRLMGN